jgi:glycosyltransferase involved in cell wall biosynthesis
VKVLFVTRWYPTPDSIYAGAFVREHARAVRGLGHDVTVLHLAGSSGGIGGFSRLDTDTDDSLTGGMPTYRLHTRAVPGGASLPVGMWAAVRAFRAIRKAGFDPDVIHAHVFTAGVPAVVIGRLSGVPVVLSEHSTDFIEGTLGRWGAMKARFAFSRADRVLPVSECLRSALTSLGMRARFEVVPNTIDTSLFFPPSVPRSRTGVRRLLFVGGLEPRKGLATLIEALARLGDRPWDWRLDVVGDGPCAAAYAAMAGDAGIGDRVRFLGPQPRSEVARLMRDSDVFVLPSRFETQGVVLLEAMASGLAIVSTTAGAIPEVVHPEDGMLVEPDDPDRLAAALTVVLGGAERFEPLATARRAAERYGLEAVGKALVRIYDEVVAERSAPRGRR